MKRFIWLLSSLLVVLLFPATYAAELSMTTSVGYDFISQQFFADSILIEGAEGTIAEWQLKKEYLDDFRATFSLLYSPYNDHRLEIRPSYEQTPEFIRSRLSTYLRLRSKKSRFSLNTEIELKQRYRDSVSAGDNYLVGAMRGKFSTKIGPSINGWIQLRSDFVSFDSTSEYSYNYYRVGPSIGLNKSFAGFSFADLSLFMTQRIVPDSSQLDYLSFGSQLLFSSLHYKGSFDIYLLGERKTYQQSDNRGDQYRLDLDIRNILKPTESFFTAQEIRFESVSYDPDDPVYNSYSTISGSILFGIYSDQARLGVGPAFGGLFEEASDIGGSQKYGELGAKVDFDYMSLGRLFLSAESITGHRDYSIEDDFQSDFLFQRVSIISDWTIKKGLSLNLLYSAEWEWHEAESDNSRIDLLSTSLSHTF